jgi:hypothetical protein
MFYIYHITGVKIGCTQNLKNRLAQQTKSEWEILETHTDINIASKREIELQKQYGYKVDTCTYYDSIKHFKIHSVIKAGHASATKSWKQNRDRELQKCSKGGKINAEKSGKPVIMCDLNGNTIMQFKNRAIAAEYINGFKSTLVGVIDHPSRTYRGYKWKSLLN